MKKLQSMICLMLHVYKIGGEIKMSLLEGYRLFTGYYVYESDMPSEAKLEFVQFLKEADADDIVDILEGQYEGVEALTEDEMEALNDLLQEKFGRAGAWVGKKAGAMKAGYKAKGGARGMVKKGLGYERLAKAKAAEKAAKGKIAKGVKPKSVPAYAKSKKELRKAYVGAVGRTALAASPAVAAAGYGGHKLMKKK